MLLCAREGHRGTGLGPTSGLWGLVRAMLPTEGPAVLRAYEWACLCVGVSMRGRVYKWAGPAEGRVSHGLLEDLGVDASHTVDGVRPGDAQVGHVDALHRALLHKGHAPQPVYIPWERGCHPLCQESPELGPDAGTQPSPYPQSYAQSSPV